MSLMCFYVKSQTCGFCVFAITNNMPQAHAHKFLWVPHGTGFQDMKCPEQANAQGQKGDQRSAPGWGGDEQW